LLRATIDLPHLHSGKVRDIYDLGGDRLLMVASDRISAFDVVMAEPIPDKGRVLTAMTAFWFERFTDVVAGHLLTTEHVGLIEVFGGALPAEMVGRTMVCRRAEMLPVECIVRGYITGSAWKEYQDSGTIHSEPAPRGLREADQLPEPLFTPSTKAETGHDVNISFEAAVDLIGVDLARRVRDASLDCYRRGAEWAFERGIIIADTKFEFGRIDGELILIDEVLTPDSSRFWPQELYQPGQGQPSFDKQFVRDWLEATDWDKDSQPPGLPEEIVSQTRTKYIEAFELLVGETFPWT
jgi:phosphoribosylaminoimidazole-succinocarboxamide synthase